ncbi:sigma factor-like helix-turn-helix DNA-binding protein [Actinoallomurus sp. CA-150999]|uniref:sigma factor-like helix-turn-helix DNA-binding protein n=1 Tax=Actinoallomurus sp. CA-150999 TaxID=3239887 RepID=UPI003D8F21F8
MPADREGFPDHLGDVRPRFGPAEIATVLDLSPATVRTRLSRARARLRSILAAAPADSR